jgi:hypothetical protein
MPDCYKKATSEKMVLMALSDQNTTSVDGNIDPANDLEMPKRQEHVAKKGRRR